MLKTAVFTNKIDFTWKIIKSSFIFFFSFQLCRTVNNIKIVGHILSELGLRTRNFSREMMITWWKTKLFWLGPMATMSAIYVFVWEKSPTISRKIAFRVKLCATLIYVITCGDNLFWGSINRTRIWNGKAQIKFHTTICLSSCDLQGQEIILWIKSREFHSCSQHRIRLFCVILNKMIT